MGFFHGQKNSFRKKNSPRQKTYVGIRKLCIASHRCRDLKQKIDNKPWHAAGPPDGSSHDGPLKQFGGRCRRRSCDFIDDRDGRRRQRRGHSSASLPRRRSRQRRLGGGGGGGVVHRVRRPTMTTLGRHRRDDDPRPRRRRPSLCLRLLCLLPPLGFRRLHVVVVLGRGRCQPRARYAIPAPSSGETRNRTDVGTASAVARALALRTRGFADLRPCYEMLLFEEEEERRRETMERKRRAASDTARKEREGGREGWRHEEEKTVRGRCRRSSRRTGGCQSRQAEGRWIWGERLRRR
jgi:hypothetical protein